MEVYVKQMHGAGLCGVTLALLMTLLFLVSAGSFVAALCRPSTVVDPDYYSHGLSYGRGGGEAPWEVSAALRGDEVEIKVVDAAGAPVAGGRVVCLVAGGKGGTVDFAEGPAGLYRTSRKILRGDVRGTVRVSRGSAHSTRRLVIVQ